MGGQKRLGELTAIPGGGGGALLQAQAWGLRPLCRTSALRLGASAGPAPRNRMGGGTPGPSPQATPADVTGVAWLVKRYRLPVQPIDRSINGLEMVQSGE